MLSLLASAAASDTLHPPDVRRPAVVLSAGTFALVEAYDYPYRLGLQYRLGARGPWSLDPGIGAAFGPDGMTFLYLDVQRDFPLGEHWFITPSLAGGYFANGDDIGVRENLQFESGIAIARRFDGGRRIGLGVYHVSNGGLSSPNNGTEAVVAFVRLPVGQAAPGH